LTRKLNHHAILLSSLCVIATTGVISAFVGSITAGIVLAGVVNGFGAVGKLAFDSIVQRHAPDANRSRVFAEYETRNQLFQVAGGLMAVLLVPSGAVGFACVGAYAAMTTAYYAFKY
jgi:ABC-type microcin C transport system permease subunit YejB